MRPGEAITFSAYDVVLRPASAPRSLRGQGTVATAVMAGDSFIESATTMSVGAPSPARSPAGTDRPCR